MDGSAKCCISHLFFQAASQKPGKIAVIHATGASRFCRQSWERISSDCFEEEERVFCDSQVSSNPPIYGGDKFYTFSEVSLAVESLSSRIRSVLDGFDDPALIRQEGCSTGKDTASYEVSASPVVTRHTREHPVDSQRTGETSISDSSVHSERIASKPHVSQNLIECPRIVGVFIVPSVEYIIATLSVLRCGEAFLPLDPSWPKERILFIISSSKIKLVLKSTSCSVSESDEQFVDCNWLVDHGICAILNVSVEGHVRKNEDHSNLPWPCENVKPRDFCYVMYTSGSTGERKGVCGTEEGLLNRFWWMQETFPLCGDDILIFKTPISFVDHIQEFLSAFLTCTTLVVPPFFFLKKNPFYLIYLLKAYHISRLIAVPSLMKSVAPVIQNPHLVQIQKSLMVLVLSGEVLPLSLWSTLCQMLPNTVILNLYGSTEVSGDCTYFDCRKLPMILQSHSVSSVPIGIPISNCDVLLLGETDEPDEGELYVGGLCISRGYLSDFPIMSSNYVECPQGRMSPRVAPVELDRDKTYFKTGDFARRLKNGDLVFIGRKDRIIKLNGQRVSLDEIENSLREHKAVLDAAVTFDVSKRNLSNLVAYIVLQRKMEYKLEQFDGSDEACEELRSSIKTWLAQKSTLTMIPKHFFFVHSLPLSSSGKVDYASLPAPMVLTRACPNQIKGHDCILLRVIKKAFCESLMIQHVSDDTDFFAAGGDSLAAAEFSFKLGVDMMLLYNFPSPHKLLNSLLVWKGSYKNLSDYWAGFNLLKNEPNLLALQPDNRLHGMPNHRTVEEHFPHVMNDLHDNYVKSLAEQHAQSPFVIESKESDPDFYDSLKNIDTIDCENWLSIINSSPVASFSRSNKLVYEKVETTISQEQLQLSIRNAGNRKGGMEILWKVSLNSCVDASPLIVPKDGSIYLYIGSHSHLFLCVDASRGIIQWEITLESRIECSAAITADFSQVIVGCYKGNIYFIDSMIGNILWVFQTGGEVKSQPAVDKCRNIVWCGSYDHTLYALDYQNHCCLCKIPCGGSVYGTPSIDTVRNIVYVGSTSGRVSAISSEDLPFRIAWFREMGAPIFGSLFINSLNGHVICCSVDGYVTAFYVDGSTIWKAFVGGPIFAAACMSAALSYQVLICSRNGRVYSFDSRGGDLLWEYDIGDPITSSAYVDEHIQFVSDKGYSGDRLVCVCSSSGRILLLRINSCREKIKQHSMDSNVKKRKLCIDASDTPVVDKYACMNLPGDIFSSPVMVAGRIFVGCRDDNLYCIGITC